MYPCYKLHISLNIKMITWWSCMYILVCICCHEIVNKKITWWFKTHRVNLTIQNKYKQESLKWYCRMNARVMVFFTLKAPNKNCSWRHLNFSLLSFEENKAWFFLWIVCLNPLPWLTWNIRSYFLWKTMKKIFMNVVCCSCDWRFKG